MLVTAAVHGTGLMGVYQTEIDSLGAQADGREEKQSEIPFEVSPLTLRGNTGMGRFR